MMSFANQTVQDFFQEGNWQGLKLIQNDLEIPLIPSNLKEVSVDCHLGLTVEEYFSLNNWQGLVTTREIENYQISEVSASEPVFSLTISVAEFFQRMVWQKQTKKEVKIASPPSNSKPQASPSKGKKQFNFQDLSDLL